MWSFTKGVLTMLDGLIDILNQIWRFSFFNNEYVQKLFGYAITLAIAWLVVKVSFEFLMKFIVKGDDRTSPLTIYKGIIIAIISMFLIVPFFDYGQKISTLLTDGVIQASSLGDGANTEFCICTKYFLHILNVFLKTFCPSFSSKFISYTKITYILPPHFKPFIWNIFC